MADTVLYGFKDPVALAMVLDETKGLDPYVSNKVFGDEYTHDKSVVSFEIIKDEDEIAQFSAQDKREPNVVNKGNRRTLTYETPRIYESVIFTAQEIEQFQVLDGQSENAIKLANDAVQREIKKLKTRLDRRIEQMCTSILVNGKLTVNQSDLDFEIDFGLDSSQFVTLTSTAKWGASAADIMGNITAWRRNIAKKLGMAGDLLLVGSEAADAIRADEKIKKQLDTSYNDAGFLKLQEEFGAAGTPVGKLAGAYIFEYNQQYSTKSGNTRTLVDMIPSKQAVLLSTKANAFGKHFGGIGRANGNGGFDVEKTKAKFEVFEDPRGQYIEWVLESRPLPVIQRPSALISAVVM
jgi:hypothetical protein